MKQYFIPPLQALRSLEAATRRRSFSRAAEELNVTHGAISHHIRSLETELGVQLFSRAGNQMIPTTAGSQLASRIRMSLGDLVDALETTRRGARGATRLEISVMSDFASFWLIPRLGDFYELFPNIDLSIHMHAGVPTPDPSSYDIGIWHRRIEEPGFQIRKLPDDHVVAVCSPALLERYPDFQIENLASMPLLRFSRRSWGEFFDAANIAGSEPARGPIFDDSGLLLRATIAGQGVSTSRLQLARDFIERGELVQLSKIQIPASLEYFFIWRSEHPREDAIDQFYHWLTTSLL